MTEEKITANNIIKIKDVNFYYNKGQPSETKALSDINLEIGSGEFVSFFGPSGSGKSTILYMISGIDKPHTGEVFFNNHNIGNFSPKEMAVYRQMGIGLIFQNFNLIPSLSVMDNVALPMIFLGLSVNKRKERSLEILEYLNIKNLANRLPYELSGGQQQRVGIARALANDPPLILADEPTGNLDSANATKIMELLKDLSRKHEKTVVLVTHEAWCLKYVDKIFYMKDGLINKTEKIKSEDLQTIEESKSIEDRIKQAHPSAGSSEIAAGYLSTFFMRGYSGEEIKRVQDIIAKRMNKQITYSELFSQLDKPLKDGGVGLWRQKAKKVADIVEEIIQENYEISIIHRKLKKHPSSPLKEEISNMQKYLMQFYSGRLSPFQRDSLHECLQERVRNIINRDHFVKVLTLPKRKGGIGMPASTALRISDRLEFLLSAGSAMSAT